MQREHLFTKVSSVGWARGEDVTANTEASPAPREKMWEDLVKEEAFVFQPTFKAAPSAVRGLFVFLQGKTRAVNRNNKIPDVATSHFNLRLISIGGLLKRLMEISIINSGRVFDVKSFIWINERTNLNYKWRHCTFYHYFTQTAAPLSQLKSQQHRKLRFTLFGYYY